MLSMPPATTISASPVWIACAASITAFSPDPQTLLTVIHSTDTGSPALMEACRAGACPSPAERTLPMMTSCTSSPRTPARRTASWMATAPRRGAGMPLRDPRKLPIGVLHALTITTSRIEEPRGMWLEMEKTGGCTREGRCPFPWWWAEHERRGCECPRMSSPLRECQGRGAFRRFPGPLVG